MSDADEEKTQPNYLKTALSCAVVIAVVKFIWPEVIPFGAFEFWAINGSVSEWLHSVWPMFAWGCGATFVLSFFKRYSWFDMLERPDALTDLKALVLRSVFAGVTEEIAFRWLIYLGMMPSLLFVNWLFFGWLGFGIPHWLNDVVFFPLADFTTMHRLHDLLYHPTGWIVGGAIIGSNSLFRDGHKYLGPIGIVNSWCIGMVMFWMLFKYGLIACIVTHTLYDVAVFFTGYLMYRIARTSSGNR